MLQIAADEYSLALKKGQREYKELTAAGRDPHPVVLDEILPPSFTDSVQEVGLLEIPAERIIGVKSAGRITVSMGCVSLLRREGTAPSYA